jgi:hypothetical protein
MFRWLLSKRVSISIFYLKNKKGFPLIFYFFIIVVCHLLPRAPRKIRLQGILHIMRPHRVEGCKLEHVNLLVRPIQNNVPDGREARGESVASSNALGDECFVGRIVFFGTQFELLDFFQVLLTDGFSLGGFQFQFFKIKNKKSGFPLFFI